MIYIAWLALIALEVWRNYYIIVKNKHNPNHNVSTILRVVVGFAFWLVTPLLQHNPMRIDQWWAMPFMMAMTFFFLFDFWLNICRDLPYWYLGDTSKLDRLQKKYPGAFPWFWWKLMLAIGSVALFEYGFKIYR